MKSKKIEDCKSLFEFFDVSTTEDSYIWIGDRLFLIDAHCIYGIDTSSEEDGKALLGCITGQLEWSKKEPIKMTEEEKELIREIAAWFPLEDAIRMDCLGVIKFARSDYSTRACFGLNEDKSKAYELLAPILQKYGEINLDDYRQIDR